MAPTEGQEELEEVQLDLRKREDEVTFKLKFQVKEKKIKVLVNFLSVIVNSY